MVLSQELLDKETLTKVTPDDALPLVSTATIREEIESGSVAEYGENETGVVTFGSVWCLDYFLLEAVDHLGRFEDA